MNARNTAKLIFKHEIFEQLNGLTVPMVFEKKKGYLWVQYSSFMIVQLTYITPFNKLLAIKSLKKLSPK